MTRLTILALFAVMITGTFRSFLLADEFESGNSPEQVKEYFAQRGKTVITFVGYSGSGYQDVAAMLREARKILSKYDPEKVIVNIGATLAGIGEVYGLAKEMKFETSGIVSIQAKKYDAEISPLADKVFFVADETWGGFKEDMKTLNPTSRAMILSSDVIVGIGGGDIARDELIAARDAGKDILYIPADMNHQIAVEKARKMGLPKPTDFKGSAFFRS